jgi:hypothetical protein
LKKKKKRPRSKKRVEKKNSPKTSEELSHFLTVTYSELSTAHPLHHLSGDHFAVNLEDLTCEFDQEDFNQGDKVTFMKEHNGQLYPLEGINKLNKFE